MAGFKAHFFTAATVGGVAATSLLAAGFIDSDTLLLCFGAVALGGMLPDIDSDSSTLLTVSFTATALIFSFFIMFSQADGLATMELLLLWLGAFLFFKLVVFELFILLTVHRGVFHSIPAAFLAMFFTTVILQRVYNLPGQIVWIVGSFLFLGFIIHLLLDELTSLNLFGTSSVRKSFGSALKLYSANRKATTLLYLTTMAFYTITPETDGIFQHLLEPETWQQLTSQFLPTGGWFQVKLSLWKWWNL